MESDLRSKVVQRLRCALAAVGLTFLLDGLAVAHPAPDKLSLSERVAAARAAINASVQDKSPDDFRRLHDGLQRLAQWWNWGNWPNWPNWGNWNNWNNWLNWFNGR
ncbi:MAG TPA: hypothetical protein VGI14_17700 [Casimicrobiaceae bacterium]|jgi:hypothetical protein